MPGVGATETGTGQTELLSDELRRMWSCRTGVLPSPLTRSGLEWPAIEGDRFTILMMVKSNPVGEGGKEDSLVS